MIRLAARFEQQVDDEVALIIKRLSTKITDHFVSCRSIVPYILDAESARGPRIIVCVVTFLLKINKGSAEIPELWKPLDRLLV
ncbi:MAG: hypothetical protein EAZ99_11210 [Alphaproteobacteria bacterium]|nr:MAG: hypothetical protein EAZ99_11210 [Alphaproteobacteria bacterium]